MLFVQRKYEAALAGAKDLMVADPLNAVSYEVAGSVYVAISRYDSAVSYLVRAIQLDNDSTYVSGWAHANLGVAYIYLGKRDEGIAELTKTVSLGSTMNSVSYASRVLDSIGYELPEKEYEKGYLPQWVVIEGEKITYNFQDTIGLTSSIHKYVKAHEEAYIELNKTFEAKLPRKLVMYVWNDKEIARKTLHRKLGFTQPKQCFSHVQRYQTLGHEIAHTLSYWAWGTEPSGRSKFISEGIAVCFDLSDADYYAYARKIIEANAVKDVMDVWQSEKKYDDKVLYPVAGAFVSFLQKNSTAEQFKSVVKGQTMDNVKVMYGSKFYTLVADFNHLMGIK